ncbi:MAG: dimethylhistidine N-methyltransferase [Melioribacteraceae bacterium]|nr:MAG: dimethylhistidine N-methyltransferase [Melioribacteraceae bacterium]
MQDLMTKLIDVVLEEIVDGLSHRQKQLPSKLFYDEKGSALFDKICRLEEYYPTRTELMLMKDNITDIINSLGENIHFVEFGSGSSLKTRLLLSNMEKISTYVPIDISEEHLFKTVESLNQRYPDLKIVPVAADYTKPFSLPDEIRDEKNIIAYFPGSTIGNFTKVQAQKFIEGVASVTGKEGGFLLGADMQKDTGVLEAAYNDSKGITAEFNLNILEHLNREFNFNFNRSKFRHKAVYNKIEGRIEMYLISLEEQEVFSGDFKFSFGEDEKILTEYSHKYTPGLVADLVSDHFVIQKYWTDSNNYFALFFLKPI